MVVLFGVQYFFINDDNIAVIEAHEIALNADVGLEEEGKKW